MERLLAWGWSETIKWVKSSFFWRLLTAGVIVFVIVYFYRDLVVYSINWFFENSEDTRNLIYFFAALFGGYLLYRRTKAAEEEVSNSKQNIEIAKQNRKDIEQNRKDNEKKIASDQRNLAEEQLGSDKSSTRLSGIHSLEEIVATHEEERVRIARILVSFVRTRARKNSEETKKDLAAIGLQKLETPDNFSAYQQQRSDVELAVRLLANVALRMEQLGEFEEGSYSKRGLFDLRNNDLRGLQLEKIDLSYFNLKGTDFSGARLSSVNFTRASISFNPIFLDLPNKKMQNATKFIKAILDNADFSDTSLCGVDFSGSYLLGAIFNRAYLNDAIFNGSIFEKTELKYSKGLTQEQINQATHIDEEEGCLYLPEGLKLP